MMKHAIAAALLAAGFLLAGCSGDDVICPPGSVATGDSECHVTAVPMTETTGESTVVVPSTSEVTTTATVPVTPSN